MISAPAQSSEDKPASGPEVASDISPGSPAIEPSSWERMALDSRRAARLLYEKGEYRSCVSRAYYAAYCVMTGKLLRIEPGLQFSYDRKNPPHERMETYIDQVFPKGKIGPETRKELRLNFTVLMSYRVDADYRPAPFAPMNRTTATHCLQMANLILNRLKV